MSKHEVTLHEGKDGLLTLKRGKTDLTCPFATPIMMRDSLGNVGQALQNCSSRCPLFMAKKVKDAGVEIALTCGNSIPNFGPLKIQTESNLSKA